MAFVCVCVCVKVCVILTDLHVLCWTLYAFWPFMLLETIFVLPGVTFKKYQLKCVLIIPIRNVIIKKASNGRWRIATCCPYI